MANISDATVSITATKCGEQVKKWLDLVDKDAWYNICTDHEGTQDGDATVFSGCASGRWAYENNLRALSDDPKERESWCSNPEVAKAYQQIIKRIEQDHTANVVMEYTDCEIGCGILYRGRLVIEWSDGKVVTRSSTEDIGYTPEGLIDEGYAENLRDALSYMGVFEDELDEAVRKYQEGK